MNVLYCRDLVLNLYDVYVDEDVYDKLKNVNIRLDSRGYPAFSLDSTQWTVGLYVMGRLKGFVVDHIDGNKFNCQRHNLRRATKSQNALNSIGHKDSKSGYRGVSKYSCAGKWQARLKVGDRSFIRTNIETKEEAALQVNKWIAETGIVAPLNIIRK